MDDETLGHLIAVNRSLRERFAKLRRECAHLRHQVAENRLQLAHIRAAVNRSKMAVLATRERRTDSSQNRERG
jgi:chromosome segregation ATPase